MTRAKPASSMTRKRATIPVRAVAGADPRASEQVLDRLSAELSKGIGRLTGPVDGPRGLARAIGADVSICQRVLAGIRARGPVSARLAQWPGASGVQLFTERLQAALGGKTGQGAMVLAARAYEQMLAALGGSHSRAVRQLRTAEARSLGEAAAPPSGGPEQRRGLNRAATELLGYEVDAVTFACAIRPIPGRPELMEGCSAVSLIGVRSHGQRICIASQNTQLRQVAGDLAGEVRFTPLGTPLSPGGRDGLLSEFCTHPIPLTAMDEGDGLIRQVVEPAAHSMGGAGIDLVLARHWSPDNNPQHTPAPSWSQVLRIRHPARRMVLDVYLHRSMLGTMPPAVGAYYWHPGLPSDPRKQWHDRLPTRPGVAVLDPRQPAPPAAWPRHAELTARLFELGGWSKDEFVGYRCEESFPIWGAAYYMTFDLRPA